MLGANESGQLGAGVRSVGGGTPVPVVGLDAMIKVSVGKDSACAIRDDRTLWCWGDGPRVPNGSSFDSLVPVEITTLSNVIDVSVGETHGCAIVDTGGGAGTVHCFGDNSTGQMGVPLGTDG